MYKRQLHGFKLKSYEFTKYKSKKTTRLITLNVIGNKNKLLTEDKLKFKALEEGTFFARDLVSEPGNILHPDEYAKRLIKLKKFGLKVTVYDKKKLKEVAGSFPTGVTVVSIKKPSGDTHGMTASSFLSLSLDPPMILFAVKKENEIKTKDIKGNIFFT